MLLPNQLHSAPQQCARHHPRGPGGGLADHPYLHSSLHPPLHTHAGGEAVLHTQVRIHCVGQTTLHQGKLSGCTICAHRRFEGEKGGRRGLLPSEQLLACKAGKAMLANMRLHRFVIWFACTTAVLQGLYRPTPCQLWACKLNFPCCSLLCHHQEARPA